MKKNKYGIVIDNNIYTAEQVPVDDNVSTCKNCPLECRNKCDQLENDFGNTLCEMLTSDPDCELIFKKVNLE